jgi:transposase
VRTGRRLALADWLKEHGVTHVAMEATGVHWRPIWAVLEGQFEQIQAEPGRRTDAKDCEWIADLLQHGLLKGSFVPPTEIQDLRDLTRYQAELRQSQNRVANRIQKFLEQANIKLRSVASNTLGVSGRQMLEAIIAGQDDAEQLAKRARGKLRPKIAELEPVLEGRVREHHRFLLAEYLDEWEKLGRQITRREAEIEKQIRPFEPAAALWQTIPGVDRVTACNLVAEIGVNMNQFPTAQHLASWTARRGAKRAVMAAVAHTMLVIGYHMLKTGHSYHELGGHYLEQINKDHLQRYFVKRLQKLGLKVTVAPVPEAA